MGVRYDLEKPEIRAELIADLVTGVEPIAALARRLQVTTSAIYLFRKRHQDEIDAALELVRHALAETWTAVKAERVASMTADVEQLDARIGREIDSEALAYLVRTKTAVLRAIADELGDIPRAKVAEPDGDVLRYEIVGVDLNVV